jgi:hypothetical protein
MAPGEDILVEDGLAIVNTEPHRPTDDAMDWSVDDVVRKLCQEPSLLPQTLNLAALAMAFRERGITGHLLSTPGPSVKTSILITLIEGLPSFE